MAKRNVAAKRILAKVRKDLKTKTKQRPNNKAVVTRRAAVNALAQGALAAPRKNFGTRASQNNLRSMIRSLDARLPRTLGLPRAVGPYTVIRTTVLHQSTAEFIMFSPFFESGKWHNWCGVEDVNATQPILGTGNTKPIIMPMTTMGDAVEVVPAALTVQVMNPAALQEATGIFAMTRVNQQLNMAASAGLTWSELKARVVSFYSPRLLTGGRLALKGVKCSSYPLDMTEYANFAPLVKASPPAQPGTWNPNLMPAALAPIVFVQNNGTPVELEFLITIEWRVRFDPGNPATSTHSYHPTLPDKAWNDVIKAMSAAGHGVEELTEDVAATGAMYGAAAALL